MTLSEICVRRPVFATMLVSACVAMGALSFGKLGVDQFPDVELPVVTVVTRMPGASPEEVESQVSEIIESAVSTIEGIDELRSTSREGLSTVNINFLLSRDRDQATQDVRDKVAAALSRLPEDVEPPVVTRFDTTAIPVLTLVVSGTGDLRDVTELSRLRVLEPLQSVSGVAEVQLIGGRKRAPNIELSADALNAHRISVDEVRDAIRQQNVEIPGGRINSGGREEVVRTVGRIENGEALSRLVVAEREGPPLVLSDIARVTDSVEEPRSLSRLDGVPAVALVIQKQAGTNTVEVVDAVLTRLDQLRKQLPPQVRVEVIRDQSRFIRRSIAEVEHHLVLGAILASLAVLFFMGSLRSTVIAAVSIPASIITTFAILAALDYTLNNFTLLALTLAVGIVIDDAIVVLENVFRHVEMGESPFDAAIKGTREITLAVMATTLSLVIIFVPTAFMEGRVGRFWQSFGITTAFAIGVSLFIALTLTPMMCALLLKPSHQSRKNFVVRAVDRLNEALEKAYGRLVRLSLRFRWTVVIVALAIIASVVPLYKTIRVDFVPQDDTSDFSVRLVMPEGSSLQASSDAAARVEQVIRGIKGVTKIFTTVGSTQGGDDVTSVEMYIAIVDLADRDYPLSDVMTATRKALKPFADLRPAVANIGGLGGGGRGGALGFSLRGPNLPTLEKLRIEMMGQMTKAPTLVDVDSAAAVRKPEQLVVVDRLRAADHGVRVSVVANTVRTLIGGERVSDFRDAGELYDVWLRLRPEDRASAAQVRSIPIRGQSGLVRLGDVATTSPSRGPSQIDRLNRVRQIDVSANLATGAALGPAIATIQKLWSGLNPPAGYELVLGGRARTLGETLNNFATALMLSFLFMYMVLAAQFESFVHPVTIMLALPLSLPFALLSLILLNDTLNIYSIFGAFMLFGIVKKNGILQVDYTNTLRAKGHALNDAIVEANMTRLRPILMTTLTLIAGMTPIALGEGPGSAARASMARVIIGGQAMSLLITLLIVPVAYSLFDDLTRVLTRKKGTNNTDPVHES